MLLQNIDTVFQQDPDRTVAHDVDILIQDGQIAEIGEGLSGSPAVDCSEKVALPGLINTHTHTPNILTRGWSDNVSLFPWLEHQARLLETADRDTRRAGGRLSAKLMLETGTTTINDMWNTYLAPDFVDLGLRAFMGVTLAEDPNTDDDAGDGRIDECEHFAATGHDSSRVHPTVPVHSVYRASEQLLTRAHRIAADNDVPFHIHLSETQTENERCQANHGLTPAGWLNELGVLDDRAVLAHCVHLTDTDRGLISEAKAGVAHCPAANLKLGSGIADVHQLHDVPVGIGTDSAASNNTLNMIRDGRLTGLLHKRSDPARITAQRVLDMMTCEAAAAIGADAWLGSLEPGKRADLVLIDLNDPTLRPAFGDAGLLSNLVYSFHGHVTTVIVEGDIVVRNGATVTDIPEARETVRRFCNQASSPSA